MTFNVTLIQPASYVHAHALSDACEYLVAMLEACGQTAQRSRNHLDPGARNVVLCSHLLGAQHLAQLPKNTILFNSEQLGAEAGWQQLSAAYRAALARFDHERQGGDDREPARRGCLLDHECRRAVIHDLDIRGRGGDATLGDQLERRSHDRDRILSEANAAAASDRHGCYQSPQPTRDRLCPHHDTTVPGPVFPWSADLWAQNDRPSTREIARASGSTPSTQPRLIRRWPGFAVASAKTKTPHVGQKYERMSWSPH